MPVRSRVQFVAAASCAAVVPPKFGEDGGVVVDLAG
jgi:hypothetical protein